MVSSRRLTPSQASGAFLASGRAVCALLTCVSCRRIGFGRAISFGAVLVIHGTFSMPTWPNALPRLNFPIFIGRMHRTVHGSDSRVLDSEGRFVPQRFEDMFAKYDTGGKGGLNWDDIQDMVYANMDVSGVASDGSPCRVLTCCFR